MKLFFFYGTLKFAFEPASLLHRAFTVNVIYKRFGRSTLIESKKVTRFRSREKQYKMITVHEKVK